MILALLLLALSAVFLVVIALAVLVYQIYLCEDGEL